MSEGIPQSIFLIFQGILMDSQIGEQTGLLQPPVSIQMEIMADSLPESGDL